MTNAQHTPAPWIYDQDGHSIYCQNSSGQFGRQICGLDDYEDDNIRDANARLIATPPELLAVLEKLWFKVESTFELQDSGLQEECLEARAIIRKAKGE